MSDILNRIIEVKWEEVAAAKQKRSLASQREEAEARRGEQLGFERSLRAAIAEALAEVAAAAPQPAAAEVAPSQPVSAVARMQLACSTHF